MARKTSPAASGRHRFVFEMLERDGARLLRSEGGVHEYRLGDGLGEYLEREELAFTFRKRTATARNVELASPGSWLHDQLIRYARERGRIVVFHLAARDDLDRESLVRRRRKNLVELNKRRERRYGSLLLFHFRVLFYSEPPEQRLVTVAYDAERKRVVNRPPSRKTLLEAPSDPEEGFANAPRPDIKTAFHAAWDALQDRIETRVESLQHEGRDFFERELETVERYYRQLIAEEKRIEKTRSSRRGQEESRRKIDLLKLEWERRVKDETERLKPQVVAHLSAVALVRVPLERWAITEEEGGAARKGEVWVDLARAEVWTPAKSRARRKR